MKKSPVIIAAGLLGLLAVLLVLFYMSPFSQIEPSRVYENLEGRGADYPFPSPPLYGNPISGKDAIVYFPFRMIDNEATEFCLNNTKKIEELCGITADQVLLDAETGFFHCTYVTLDNESGEVKNLVDLEKSLEEVGEPGVATVRGTFWKSELSNFSFKDTCTEGALADLGS